MKTLVEACERPNFVWMPIKAPAASQLMEQGTIKCIFLAEGSSMQRQILHNVNNRSLCQLALSWLVLRLPGKCSHLPNIQRVPAQSPNSRSAECPKRVDFVEPDSNRLTKQAAVGMTMGMDDST